jgi:hypothetical protein
MPVRRFRSIEEMTPARQAVPGDGGNLRAALALSRTCLALDGRRMAPGVRRYRSTDDAWQARQRWERDAARRRPA